MKMMRVYPALVGVLGCVVSTWAAAQTPIKIGFVAELSGPQAVLGQDQYDGFMLFVEHHDGKLGGVPVTVLKEDSQLKPEVAIQIVQKLIDKENVPIITGITFSNIMMAIQKPVTKKDVFLISSNAGPSELAGSQCSPYQFVTSFETNSLANNFGLFANDRQYNRVVLMAPNYQAGKDFLAGFKKTFKGTVVDEVYTSMGQQDYSSELTQVAASKPDAVFVFYPGGMGINFVRQYNQMGLIKSIPLMSLGAVDGTTFGALKESALGVYNGSPWGPDLDNPANHTFVEAFEQKYHRIPTMVAADSYDAAQLLDSAIAKTKGNLENKPAFMAVLKSADFPSVRGHFKFGNNNFPIEDFYVQEVAKDNKGRVSLKTVAAPLKDHRDSYASNCSLK